MSKFSTAAQKKEENTSRRPFVVMSTSTIEFHLDKLEDDLYRQREEMLEQNNAVETTTTTTTTIPTTTLPKGYEQQHFVLSEFGRRQTKERLNTHESGQSQSDPERRTLPRAPIRWVKRTAKRSWRRKHRRDITNRRRRVVRRTLMYYYGRGAHRPGRRR